MGLTVRKQAEIMRRSWPDFRVLEQNRWSICWEGILRPLCQKYRVQISLLRKRKNRDSRAKLSTLPSVRVIDPLLHRRVENPSDPIPHHYPNRDCSEQPFLCLYDPAKNEWHSRLTVARTIVPWTIDWLACYEGWLATGEWTGGGRH